MKKEDYELIKQTRPRLVAPSKQHRDTKRDLLKKAVNKADKEDK